MSKVSIHVKEMVNQFAIPVKGILHVGAHRCEENSH